MKRIVTMQDLSCIGKCSLTVALPVLSAMGLECAVLPTAVLSAHTAFEGFHYEPLSLTPVADHWQQLGLQFDMIYTGYLGGRAQVDQALDFFTRFPAMRLVDPVMADHGALYAGLEPDFPAVLRTLCAQADLITPNITEAALLAGLPYEPGTHSDAYLAQLFRALGALGAGVVTVTGVRPQPDVIGNVACDCRTGEMYASMRPAHPGLFYGTGDVFASALSGLLVRGAPLSDALETATALTDESICRSLWRDTPRHFGVDFEGALPAYIRRVEKIFEA